MKITTLGVYPSKVEGNTVWFGETENMFLYASFNAENQYDNPLAIATQNASDMFRFSKGCTSLDKAEEEAGIVFRKYDGFPRWMENHLKREIERAARNFSVTPGSTKNCDIEELKNYL